MILVTVCDLEKRVVIYKIILKIDEKKNGENEYLDGLGIMGLLFLS